MRFLLFVLTCFGVLLMAESCKKECHDKSNPDCENYDPCFGENLELKMLSQQKISDGLAIDTNFLVDDTIAVTGTPIVFRPLAKDNKLLDKVSYRWFIRGMYYSNIKGLSGHELVNAPPGAFSMVFQKPEIVETWINVVYECGKTDSVYKRIKIVSPCEALSHGDFKGAWDDNPNDSFVIKVRYTNQPKDTITNMCGFLARAYCWVENMDMQNGVADIFATKFSITYTTAYFTDEPGSDPKFNGGYIKVNPITREVEMIYKNSNTGRKRFVGRKIK